jgi:hypothetical protein
MQGSKEQRNGQIDQMNSPVFEVITKGGDGREMSQWHCLRCLGRCWWKNGGKTLPRHNAHYCLNGLIEENPNNTYPDHLKNHPNRLKAKGGKDWIKNVGPTFEGAKIKKAHGNHVKAGRAASSQASSQKGSQGSQQSHKEEEEEYSEEEDSDGAASQI